MAVAVVLLEVVRVAESAAVGARGGVSSLDGEEFQDGAVADGSPGPTSWLDALISAGDAAGRDTELLASAEDDDGWEDRGVLARSILP